MPNEIYHRSDWGESKAEGFGDVYYDHAATNKLYNHSDYYENSDGTDATLKDLNNKASIVLTPTAYSDGSLNTVIPPYQVLPTELVTNGTFDTDSDWTKDSGWSIENGEAIHTGSGSYISQAGTTIGKIYRVVIEVTQASGSGFPQIYMGGLTTAMTSAGTYTFYITATSTLIRLRGINDCKVTSISVKEVQEADFDFSRGSSATRVNEQGLVEDSQGDDYPRIDFTDGTGSLLLEPQRTNSLNYSGDFSEWSTTGTVTSGQTGFDGSNNAFLFEQSGNAALAIQSNTTSGVQTFSVFAKGSVQNGLRMYAFGSSNVFTYFDLNLGVVESTSNTISNSIEDYGDGWYRCSMTFNQTNTVLYFYLSNNQNSNADTGSILLQYAQLENGSYQTSYIPTESASVTRSADVANNSGNADLFNDSEGVLYAEIAALADDGTNRRISISNNSTQNRVVLMYHSTSNVVRGFVSSGGSLVSDMTYTVSDTTQFNKIAFSYKQDDFKLWIDGVQRATDDSGATPTGLNTLRFQDGNGSFDFYGNVKCIAVFKEALSNDLLERLTGEGYESFRLLAEANNYTII